MSGKKCFKCGAVLPLTEFYKHPEMSDGHLNKCKECTKRDVKENRVVKRDYYHQFDRERTKTPKRQMQKNSYAKAAQEKTPQKYKARMKLHNATRDGKVQRQPCVFCGNELAEAHHQDYSKPFDVVWVCFKCHRERLHGQTVTAV